jgi:hypothetical protein
LSSDFRALLRREFVRSRSSAFCAPELPQRNGCRIPSVLNAILNLACGDVTDELGEGNRIAWSLLAGFSHALIIAQAERGAGRIQERGISN